jgi:hypothetical protein
VYLTGYGPSSTEAVQLSETCVAPVPATLRAGAVGAVWSSGSVADVVADPDRFPEGSMARIVNV